MAHPAYLREKAQKMRREGQFTVDELAERLGLSRSTIYYWVRDIPIARKPNTGFPGRAQRLGTRAMQAKYLRLREIAYRKGQHNFHGLSQDPTFRDFVCLYIGEGYKRDRNSVALGNSDPGVIDLAYKWIRAFSRNPVTLALQYHADQNPAMLVEFWSDRLKIEPRLIRFQRKSNSGQLTGRVWRSKFGVVSVNAADTHLRSMLQAWMDQMQRQWLDSVIVGA
jgi:predicted DNA-binding transcriptional regulator AlpA